MVSLERKSTTRGCVTRTELLPCVALQGPWREATCVCCAGLQPTQVLPQPKLPCDDGKGFWLHVDDVPKVQGEIPVLDMIMCFVVRARPRLMNVESISESVPIVTAGALVLAVWSVGSDGPPRVGLQHGSCKGVECHDGQCLSERRWGVCRVQSVCAVRFNARFLLDRVFRFCFWPVVLYCCSACPFTKSASRTTWTV